MKKGLIFFFVLISFLLKAQPPSTDSLGFWKYDRGLKIIGSDTCIIIGSGQDTIFVRGVDFNLDSVKAGWGIPFKSKCYLQMGKSNTIDTGFWKRVVYPTTVPPCVDYANRTFFKIAQHTLNSDSTERFPARITEIALYNNNTDSTARNTYFGTPAASGYWVKKLNYDGTPATDAGDGSFRTPYLTIEACYKAKSAGSTINVGSGIYYEQYNGTSIRFLYLDKNMTIKGVGNTDIRSNTTIIARTTASVVNFYNCVFNGYNTIDYCIYPYPTSDNACNIYNCALVGAKTQSIKTDLNTTYTQSFDIRQCISDKIGSVTDYVTMQESYMQYGARLKRNIYWNKFKNIQVDYLTGSRIKFNEWDTYLTSLVDYYVTGSTDISYNIFNYHYVNQGSNIITISNSINSSKNQLNIHHNKFYSLDTDSFHINNAFIDCQYGKNAIITDNLMISKTKAYFHSIYLESNDSVWGKCIINNNEIHNNTLTGGLITIGGETQKANKFDNSEVKGNKLRGHLYEYPGTSGTTHALFTNCGRNIDVSLNEISYTQIGYVGKAGQEQSYTSGGLHHNLFIENSRAIWVGGIDDYIINNNTIIKTTSYNPYGTGQITVTVNSPFPTQLSKRVRLYNNIIYSTNNCAKIYFDQSTANEGAKVINSTIYNDYLTPNKSIGLPLFFII